MLFFMTMHMSVCAKLAKFFYHFCYLFVGNCSRFLFFDTFCDFFVVRKFDSRQDGSSQCEFNRIVASEFGDREFRASDDIKILIFDDI